MLRSVPRLLIACSDRFLRESICMGLGGAFEYVQVASGAELVEQFPKALPDAVLIAAELEGGQGPEFCERLRSLEGASCLPIYLFGDTDEDELVHRSFEKGATDFLLSPVHLGILSRRMQREMRQCRLLSAGKVEPDGAALFRMLPDPGLVCDDKGGILRVNEAFVKRFSPKEDWVGGSLAALLPGLDIEAVFCGLVTRVELYAGSTGSLVGVNLYVMRLPDGTPGARYVLFMREGCQGPSVDNSLPSETASQSVHILILEDYEVVSRSLRRLLERDGHRVDLALSGDEALHLFAKGCEKGDPYTLAILDLSLPGSSGGAEVLAKMRKIDPEVRGIVMSGGWNDPVMLRPELYGFRAILRKPFTRDELRQSVSRALAEE